MQFWNPNRRNKTAYGILLGLVASKLTLDKILPIYKYTTTDKGGCFLPPPTGGLRPQLFIKQILIDLMGKEVDQETRSQLEHLSQALLEDILRNVPLSIGLQLNPSSGAIQSALPVMGYVLMNDQAMQRAFMEDPDIPGRTKKLLHHEIDSVQSWHQRLA